MAIGAVTPGTVADLLEQLGNIPPQRVWMRPTPGTAKEKDVIAARESPERRLCELIDGVLVEKAMGSEESLLAAILVELMGQFAHENDLGLVLGADGMLRILPQQVRIPDVAFLSWDRLPEGRLPRGRIARVTPDLAVEVLSPSNTEEEMERKLDEYFQAGVRLAWLIDPATQTAEVYTSRTEMRRLGKNGALDGGDVLPGFKLPLKQLFGRTRRQKRK